MDLLKVSRELKELDVLEQRLKEIVNPSKVLLKAIEDRRTELLNPKVEK